MSLINTELRTTSCRVTASSLVLSGLSINLTCAQLCFPHTQLDGKFITSGTGVIFGFNLLISAAITVMLCHRSVSRSRGFEVNIEPFPELMLNTLSISVWRSTEYLQIQRQGLEECFPSNFYVLKPFSKTRHQTASKWVSFCFQHRLQSLYVFTQRASSELLDNDTLEVWFRRWSIVTE